MKQQRTFQSAARALVLLLAAAAAACQSTRNRGTAQNTYIGAEGGEVEEVFGDRSLARKFVLLEVRTARRDERLHVQFDLKNTTNQNLDIEWAIEWLDDDLMKVDWPENWRPTTVGGQGYETIAQTAPIPEASSFRLGIRKPNVIR